MGLNSKFPQTKVKFWVGPNLHIRATDPKVRRVECWGTKYSRVLSPQLFVVVQSLSCVWFCDPMDCSMPGLPIYHQLPEFTQTHVHWIGDAIQPSHPLSSPSPAFNLSQHQGLFQFSASGGQSIGVLALASFLPKNTQDWSPLEWDWLDLLAVQGTLKSLLQHHSSKASVLRHSAFFITRKHLKNGSDK